MSAAAPAQTNAQTKMAPGELFGMPDVTRWTEQPDSNDTISLTGALGNSTPLTGQTTFKQSDIVFGWRWLVTIPVVTLGAGSSPVYAASDYFPFNFIQQNELKISNLYDLLDLQSGIDLAIFNAYRPLVGGPLRGASQNNFNPQTFPYGGQANIFGATGITVGSSTGVTSASVILPFEIPACIFLDEYVDLDSDGNILSLSHRCPVSPLYASGTARLITPQYTFAPYVGANGDVAPITLTSGTIGALTAGTYVAQNRYQRYGMYGTNNPVEQPTNFNWRYALVSKRYGLGGVSLIDIPLKAVINNGGGGQILSMFFRFYDPAANSGKGGALALSNISLGKLLYGSGLIRFQDIPVQMQWRVIRQHDWLPPIGVWLWDLAIDDNRRLSNAKALNAYRTDITAHFDFTGALSASAYVVVGVEYLSYVLDQPVIM